MTTIINTPPSGEKSDSGMGIVLGVIIAIVLIVLFFVYVLPRIRNNQVAAPQGSSTNINVQLPTPVSTPPAGNTSPASPSSAY